MAPSAQDEADQAAELRIAVRMVALSKQIIDNLDCGIDTVGLDEVMASVYRELDRLGVASSEANGDGHGNIIEPIGNA